MYKRQHTHTHIHTHMHACMHAQTQMVCTFILTSVIKTEIRTPSNFSSYPANCLYVTHVCTPSENSWIMFIPRHELPIRSSITCSYPDMFIPQHVHTPSQCIVRVQTYQDNGGRSLLRKVECPPQELGFLVHVAP